MLLGTGSCSIPRIKKKSFEHNRSIGIKTGYKSACGISANAKPRRMLERYGYKSLVIVDMKNFKFEGKQPFINL